ncbi:hypothetical protein NE237_028782 [Protea cynaroides]|uniref:Uncharacterized protein n=1 Tax=Protea cynaroides TaxID=273540 RepID=A0A9Q0JVH0_9MAGN|nr:hypothetical protein NE237_028782 [Protea cynaroides]
MAVDAITVLWERLLRVNLICTSIMAAFQCDDLATGWKDGMMNYVEGSQISHGCIVFLHGQIFVLTKAKNGNSFQSKLSLFREAVGTVVPAYNSSAELCGFLNPSKQLEKCGI